MLDWHFSILACAAKGLYTRTLASPLRIFLNSSHHNIQYCCSALRISESMFGVPSMPMPRDNRRLCRWACDCAISCYFPQGRNFTSTRFQPSLAPCPINFVVRYIQVNSPKIHTQSQHGCHRFAGKGYPPR